jgi:type IV pilus assembly protein PilQ
MKRLLASLAAVLTLLQPAMATAASRNDAAEAPPGEEDGERISLDLKGADLVDVLRYFSTLSRLNLVLDPSVRGTVTVRLIDVPWDAALRVVLKTHGLWYTLESNVLYVAPAGKLAQEEAREASLAEEKELAEPLRTAVLEVHYAEASALAEVLRQTALSKRGSVIADPRTNRLIITDVASALPRSTRTVRMLDRP